MTTAERIRCPYCGGEVSLETTVCPSCQEDLSALIKLQYAHAIHYNEAVALARENKPEQAIARAELALASKTDFAPAHVLLAKLYARQERWPEAMASVRRAVELAPGEARVRALAAEIEASAQEDEQRQLAQQTGESRARRSSAEKHLAMYERDVQRAFGLGALAMAGLALFLRLLFGRSRD
jgi:tetratricopeptide (TPR) repeat protein